MKRARVALVAAHTATLVLFVMAAPACTVNTSNNYHLPQDAFATGRPHTYLMRNLLLCEWFLLSLSLLVDLPWLVMLIFVYCAGAHGSMNFVGCSGCPLGNEVHVAGPFQFHAGDSGHYCPVPRYYNPSDTELTLGDVSDVSYCWHNGCSQDYSPERSSLKWALLGLTILYCAASIKVTV